MRALQIDAREIRLRKVHAAEVGFGAGFSARFHPSLVLIQNFGKIDQRNSDRAFSGRKIFYARILAGNFILQVFDFQSHLERFPPDFPSRLQTTTRATRAQNHELASRQI